MSGRSLVVVGGGAIGLAVAWYAQQEGFDVTLVERGAPGHDSCSLGNAGMVVPSHFVPLAAPGMVRGGLRALGRRRAPIYVRLRIDGAFLKWSWNFCRSANAAHVERAAPALRDFALLSRNCYEELATALGDDFKLERNGLLMLCATTHALAEETRIAAMAERLGLEARVLDTAGVAALEPNMRMQVAGGVYFPLDSHLCPQRFVAALSHDLKANGARFAWSVEALGWRTERGRVVALLTTSGDFSADEFVLAAGAWTPHVTRGLGLRLPVEAGKGYSLTLPRPRAAPRSCAILVEARVAVTPMGTALRFAGTLEFSGLDRHIDVERVRAITNSVAKYYPDFRAGDFDGVPAWCGLRPCSPDGLPYIGRVARFANFSVAAGHAMMGISLAPATGKVMADILTSRAPRVSVDMFAPERFG